MAFKLKPGQESFIPMSGPMAGRKFLRGSVYEEIPESEIHRFEQVKKQSTTPLVSKKSVPASGKEKASAPAKPIGKAIETPIEEAIK